MKNITGLSYTQSDAQTRDRKADITAALEAHPHDSNAALMQLHALGYDCSGAKVVIIPKQQFRVSMRRGSDRFAQLVWAYTVEDAIDAARGKDYSITITSTSIA